MTTFDFHTHSHFSDGEHSPKHLAKIASAAGIKQLALTDHDCVDGLAELKSNSLGLEIINGVEISTSWQDTEIHVLGLLIDPDHKAIQELLKNQQSLRRERIKTIHQKLCKLGITGLLEYIGNLPCKALTRTHVSNFLIREGYSKNNQKAFKVFFGQERKSILSCKLVQFKCECQCDIRVRRYCRHCPSKPILDFFEKTEYSHRRFPKCGWRRPRN